MVSRERLLRFGATIAERASTKRVRLLAQVLLLAGVAFLVLRVRALWHGGHVDFASVDWLAIGGSVAVAAVGTAAGAVIWLAILRNLGLPTHRHWLGIFFQAQIAKYIPGSVWQYAGRAALSRAHGIPARPVGMSLPIEFASSALAGGVTAAFLLGWWGAALVAAAVVVLVAIERPARSRSRAALATVQATRLFVPVWLLLGASFWLCTRGLVAVSVRSLPFYLGAFAVAWLAGLLAIYAPGGLGVREAVLVALLSGRIGAADALVVAVASRGVLTLVDVVLASFGFLLLRTRKTADPHPDGPRPSLSTEPRGTPTR